MPSPSLRFALLACLALGAACTERGGGSEPDGGPSSPDAAIYEPPRADLVAPVGSDATLDLATWNIENFPAGSATPRLVADLIASLELDFIAVEEITDAAAFDELVARLPDHAGLLSSDTYGDGSYQKVGFIYREELFELTGGALLFTSEGLDFPRPPLSVKVTVEGKSFTAIALHLKAGVAGDDVARRTGALVTLEAHLRGIADGSGDDVIVMGDYNQARISDLDDQVWAPILAAPDRYTVVTQAAADAGLVSYLPFGGRLIDHAVVTAGFGLGAGEVVVPRLDQDPIGYTENVSDHLPVVIRFPR